MSLASVYPTFITDVQAEIARRGKEITTRLVEGDSFDELLDNIYKLRNLIQELENYYISDFNIVDMSGSPWFSHIRYGCSGSSPKPDHLVELDMQRVYKEYCIKTYLGSLFPLAPIYIGGSGDCCNIPAYPPGALNGEYYLSYDYSTRSYTWVRSDSFIYRKEFLWNGGPQEFTVNVSATSIHMVFVNGQLIPDRAYELVGNVVRLLDPPIKLDNTRSPVRIIVYAGLRGAHDINTDALGFNQVVDEFGNIRFDANSDRNLAFIGKGINILFDPLGNKILIDGNSLMLNSMYREESIWVGGGNTFTLQFSAAAIMILAINGQIQSNLSMTFTPNSDVITLNDELEIDDEILVLYIRTNVHQS